MRSGSDAPSPQRPFSRRRPRSPSALTLIHIRAGGTELLGCTLPRKLGKDRRGQCIGVVTDYEGVDTLLRTIALTRGSQPDVAALIVGDGPERASLQALATELGITDAVVFTGRLDQTRVPDHYALLDLFTLPRHDLEVCRAVTPLKPFEAQAMGIPVIASDLPALAKLTLPQVAVASSNLARLGPSKRRFSSGPASSPHARSLPRTHASTPSRITPPP